MRVLSTALLLLGLGIGLAPSLRASTTFNFSSNTTPGTLGNIYATGAIGNTLTFCNGVSSASPCSAGQFSVLATAWSTTGVSPQPAGSLQTAAVGQYYPYGLGVCNSSEGAGCTSPQHTIDDVTNVDFILLTFSTPVTSLSFNLSTWNTTQDLDATYYAGNCATTCTPAGKTVLTGGTAPLNSTLFGANASSFTTANVNFAGTTNTGSGVGTVPVNVTINPGTTVNWVLIGASITNTDGTADQFKLSSMTYSTVPEPATFGMAGAALAALGLLRRRKLLSAKS